MPRLPDPEVRQWWQQLIDSFDPEQLSVAEFCREQGVSPSSFYQWRRKLHEQPPRATRATEGDDNGPSFVPVQIQAPGVDPLQAAADEVATIHLPGGVRIEIPATQPEMLAKAIGEINRQDPVGGAGR